MNLSSPDFIKDLDHSALVSEAIPVSTVHLLYMFIKKYNEYPTVLSNGEELLHLSVLLKKLRKNKKFQIIHEIRKNLFNHLDDSSIVSLVFEYGEGIIVCLSGMYSINEPEFYSSEVVKKFSAEDILVDSVTVLYTRDSKDNLNELIKIFKKCEIEINESNSLINMITFEDNHFGVRELPIINNYNLNNEELELHYGENFSEFNSKLIAKLVEKKKGLVLFHGEPGTGKTHYIRHLISELSKLEKTIVYIPTVLIDNILDPSFISFLTEYVSTIDNTIILVIEDAESLLIDRESSSNYGISNLLNITDGILNDILGIQVIATFNTKEDNIDTALLRPERLISRKYFGKLSNTDIQSLVKHLDIPNFVQTSDKMSLAEVYALKNQNEIILHNLVEEDTTRKFGFSNN